MSKIPPFSQSRLNILGIRGGFGYPRVKFAVDVVGDDLIDTRDSAFQGCFRGPVLGYWSISDRGCTLLRTDSRIGARHSKGIKWTGEGVFSGRSLYGRFVGRDGRVAEGARLESVYTGNRIVGSNPTLSARFSFQRTCGIATRFAPIFRNFSRNAVLGERGKINAPQAESQAVP